MRVQHRYIDTDQCSGILASFISLKIIGRNTMDWPMVRRVERQARRMHEMMDRLNVDALALVRLNKGDVYAKARSTCLFCGTSDMCLRWLDGHSRSDGSPNFCPNLRVFQTCMRERPQS
jgi:hypothetical protein